MKMAFWCPHCHKPIFVSKPGPLGQEPVGSTLPFPLVRGKVEEAEIHLSLCSGVSRRNKRAPGLVACKDHYTNTARQSPKQLEDGDVERRARYRQPGGGRV